MWHSVLPVREAGKSHAESTETSGASYAGSDKPLDQRTQLRDLEKCCSRYFRLEEHLVPGDTVERKLYPTHYM